jgi:hypothetical protein
METTIKSINPREDDDSPVMNVVVQYRIPEKDGRFNVVTAEVYVDKTAGTLSEISDLAKNNALGLLRNLSGGR